jgi:hypothetical protein
MYGVGKYNFCDGDIYRMESVSDLYLDSMGSEDPDHKEAGKMLPKKGKRKILCFEDLS